MALSDLYKWHWPDGKEFRLPHWLRLAISIVALLLAQFLAYRDQGKNLARVIEEKRELSIVNDALKGKIPGQCWVDNHFESINSKGNPAATSAVVWCNYKVEAPYTLTIQFDQSFSANCEARLMPITFGLNIQQVGNLCVLSSSGPDIPPNQPVYVRIKYPATDKPPKVTGGGFR